ncbi:MAG: hypothetical protein ABI693_26295 [Bryobacteraceae bacterium]
MLRSQLMKLALGLLVATALLAADKPIFPDQFGKYKLVERAAVGSPEPAALASEYGFEAAESAHYKGPQKLTVTTWRMKDSTGALGFYQWQRTPQAAWFQKGRHVLQVEGTPAKKDIQALLAALPPAGEPLPPVYLPAKDRTAGSERYILGQASLRQFESRLPVEVARFDLGPEIQLAKYQTPAGEAALAVFSYPTPQIARIQVKEFEKLPGAAAHRSGPLVAVVFGPSEEAKHLAAAVEYRASVMTNEPTRDYEGNPGDLLIAIFQMVGYIILFCIGAGVLVGVFHRIQDRGFTNQPATEAMIRLHIED